MSKGRLPDRIPLRHDGSMFGGAPAESTIQAYGSWCDNFIFEEMMTIVDGDKSLITCQDSLGRLYYMTLKGLIDVIQTCEIQAGKVRAKWTFTRYGYGAYALILAK